MTVRVLAFFSFAWRDGMLQVCASQPLQRSGSVTFASCSVDVATVRAEAFSAHCNEPNVGKVVMLLAG